MADFSIEDLDRATAIHTTLYAGQLSDYNTSLRNLIWLAGQCRDFRMGKTSIFDETPPR